MKISTALLMALLLSGCAVVGRLYPSEPTVGLYKVGNPYQINGSWYYPSEDFEYDEVGVSSWYGDDFHGKPTANGEIFNKNALTAAHKTLPLPSIVRVTNLENKKSVILRINDRGPFVNDRLIDVSHAAALALGFRDSGLTKVRVKVLEKETREAQAFAKQGIAPPDLATPEATPAPIAPVESMDLAANGAPQATGETMEDVSAPRDLSEDVNPSAIAASTAAASVATSAMQAEKEPSRLVMKPSSITEHEDQTARRAIQNETANVIAQSGASIQAGAFSSRANAEKLAEKLSVFGKPVISETLVNGQKFYRVRIGQFESAGEAESLRSKLYSRGIPAHIVFQ